MKKDFKEIAQAMSAKEIIMAMVNGLKNPFTTVDMDTYGFKTNEGTCFGCAATNAICSIMGRLPELPNQLDMVEDGLHSSGISTDSNFVKQFESAINFLRMGKIEQYNHLARKNGFSIIKPCKRGLPYLQNDYTVYDLLHYIGLAQLQEEKS